MKYKKIYDSTYVKKYADKEGEGRIENIVKYIDFDKNMNILDVGCGNGFLANIIAPEIQNYTGIDISKEFISDARKRVKFKNAVFQKVELKDFAKSVKHKFDIIFLLDVTEHVPDYDLVPIFKMCYQLLNKTGFLIIHTPNGEYFMEVLKEKRILKQTTGHIAIRNSKQYIELLKKSGFENVKVKKLNHYNKILKKLFLFSKLPFIGKLFEPRLLINSYK